MVFKKSQFFIHAGSGINFTSIFRSFFPSFFLAKNNENLSRTHVWKSIETSVFFLSFWAPKIDKKGPKRDVFFRLAVQRGVRRHPGTPRGRILTLQGGLFEPPGRHFRTSWGVSGTILKGLGGFLGHLGLMLGGKLQQIGANSRKQQQTATEASSKQQQTAVIANRN